MDALASLLHGVHADGALFGQAIMRPPWTIRFEDGARLTLVAMLRGQGALLPDGDTPLPLRPGDVAIVTGPEPFSLADDPATRTPPLHVVCEPDGCVTPGDDDFRIGVRTCGEALDGPTVLLTGSYRVSSHVGARLLGVLPRALAVASCQGDSWPIMELAVAECEREAPGQQAVLDRLLDLLLLTVLREWFTRPEAGAPSWYH